MPVDAEKSPVTAIIYDATKFYPDNETVLQVDSVFAAQFSGTASKEKVEDIVLVYVAFSDSETERHVNYNILLTKYILN